MIQGTAHTVHMSVGAAPATQALGARGVGLCQWQRRALPAVVQHLANDYKPLLWQKKGRADEIPYIEGGVNYSTVNPPGGSHGTKHCA